LTKAEASTFSVAFARYVVAPPILYAREFSPNLLTAASSHTGL
jgi:hypothetical protein